MARRDVYQEITDQVIAALEAGTVPWQRPWREFGMQRNLTSGRPYRGVNQLLTQVKQQVRGFETPWWLTFRAAQGAGGNVRRGERGTMVVLWKRIRVKDEQTDEEEIRWWMKPYTVFNLDQVDGVDAPELDREAKLDFDPIAAAEAIVASMPSPPAIIHAPGGGYYLPASDEVYMPPRESFRNEPGYYATLFHELTHSTGHPSRLDRELAPRSREEAYSREELIAQLGASMLCAQAEIDPQIEQSASYIASWLTALRDDKRMVAVAAGRAQRAADYILGAEFEDAEPASLVDREGAVDGRGSDRGPTRRVGQDA
jgi:antirestriction protein ArdC